MSIAAEMAMPQFYRDPYPFYAQWRSHDPIQFDERLGTWFLATYADSIGVLRDARFHVCRPTLRSQRDGQGVQQLCDIAYRWLLFENPPDHTRLRKLVNHAFALDFVSEQRPAIESIIAGILDECAERGSFDLIADVAAPVSVVALAGAMGLPAHDAPHFRRWSAQIAPLLDGSLRQSYVDAAAQAVGETVEYLNPIVRARRVNPGHDVISRLAATREHGVEPLEIELMATCVLLLTAGHETTNALLGNGVLALLKHPEELHRLRRDPSLGTLAVEEFLRFESPVQVTSRQPDRDVEWAGVKFARNIVVNLLLGSANRDSAQFVDAERLDVGRTKNAHIAFGAGIHFCPGAGLSRLVTRIAIEQILKRFPNLALGPGDPVMRAGAVVRGFSSIPVHV